MKDELFAELVQSVREGGAILRAEVPASRRTEIAFPDVKKLRESRGLSQTQFARALGIEVATLRNWEQGRRKPVGPARVASSGAKQPGSCFLFDWRCKSN